jgi:membrane-anchored protein YejM (alkaline phosphatase superfamily)
MFGKVEMRVKRFFGRCSSLLTGFVSSNRSTFAFLTCLLALTLVYRVQLTVGLFTNRVRPFDFSPTYPPVWFALVLLSYDLAFVFLCFLLALLVSRMAAAPLIRRSRLFPVLRISGVVLIYTVLILLVLIHGVQGRLLFDVQTGVDTSVIKEAFSGISVTETFKFIEARDYLFLLFPLGLFWLILRSPLGFRVWMSRVAFFWIILLLSVFLSVAKDKTKNVPDEIRLNPTLFLLSDVAENMFFAHSGKDQSPVASRGDRSGTEITRHEPTHPREPGKILPGKSTHPWNIVFLIMESVGTRYIFDMSDGNAMPMPFLHKISREGWFLRKHYTTSNVSTKAVFSLLSGFYDFFNRETFGTRRDAEVPAIQNWLGKGYDSFLVTPSSISWYFPTGFVKNSGLSEIHSYENLKFKIKEEFHSLGHYIARDEVQTVDFFLQRLSQAKEPFLGIYISFTAHFPYFDYGEDYRIMKDDGRLISRYYNNLYLLDRMIKRIYDHLQKKGLLEHTILVIVGDHGQAFGQHHPNNYMHYRYSYNENLEAPAILYQPSLFRPRAVGFPTSHVDILPTLLDAMRVSYSPQAFDGASLFDRSKRKPIFFYGLEESFSSLDSQLIKVQYSLKKKRCWAFDLKRDPDEKNPLDCSLYPFQAEALHQFVSDHDSYLLKYNAAVREKNGTSRTQPSDVKNLN